MKRTFSTELAYVFGIVFVAGGVVLMERPTSARFRWWSRPYLLYRWLSPVENFRHPFGAAEYCWQAAR